MFDKKEYKRNYRLEHPEQRKAGKKRYRQKYPEKIKAARKKYRLLHPMEVKIRRDRYLKRYYVKYPWMRYYESTKRSCQIRKLTHSLTKEQVKELWFRDNAQSMIRPSIDRIDNDIGYSMENCRFIELLDNWFKQYYKGYTIEYKITPNKF